MKAKLLFQIKERFLASQTSTQPNPTMLILQPLFKDTTIIIPATSGDEKPSKKSGFVHSCETFAKFQREGGNPTPPTPVKLFAIAADCKIKDLFRFYWKRLQEVTLTPAQIPTFVREHSKLLASEGRPNLFFTRQDNGQGDTQFLIVDVRVVCLGDAIIVNKLYSDSPAAEKPIEARRNPRLIIADRAAA